MADTEEMEMGANSDSESEESMDESKEQQEETENVDDNRPNVYLPGQPLQEGEELICDQSAYVMLHQAQSGAPCLSFDIVKDKLGDNRDQYPLTTYIVAGTQAARTHANNVIVMKMSNLHKTGGEEESSDEESDDEDNEEPNMASAMVKHLGCVNRIRSCNIDNVTLAATWSELGRVNIWNLTKQMQLLDNPVELAAYIKNNKGNSVMPIFTFTGHQQEGFGIDWSKSQPGVRFIIFRAGCSKHS